MAIWGSPGQCCCWPVGPCEYITGGGGKAILWRPPISWTGGQQTVLSSYYAENSSYPCLWRDPCFGGMTMQVTKCSPLGWLNGYAGFGGPDGNGGSIYLTDEDQIPCNSTFDQLVNFFSQRASDSGWGTLSITDDSYSPLFGEMGDVSGITAAFSGYSNCTRPLYDGVTYYPDCNFRNIAIAFDFTDAANTDYIMNELCEKRHKFTDPIGSGPCGRAVCDKGLSTDYYEVYFRPVFYLYAAQGGAVVSPRRVQMGKSLFAYYYQLYGRLLRRHRR